MARRYQTAVWPALAAVVLVANCILLSPKKAMWMDEIITYYPAARPTFHTLWSFITDKVQGSHYLFFIVAWLWARIFSASALSLRLLSCLGIIGAMVITWRLLARVHGASRATVASLIVFLIAPEILLQNCEARFYGQLLCACAAVTSFTVHTASRTTFHPGTAIGQALLHGVLPLTHPLGFGYSLMHIVIAAGYDLRRRRLRLWYYASAFAGWLLFIPFLPAFRLQLELSKPHFWIPKPTLHDLQSSYGDGPFFIMLTILVGVALALRSMRAAPDDQPRNDGLLLLIGVAYLLTPLAVFLISLRATPMLLPRYVIPAYLGWAILLSALLNRYLPDRAHPALAVLLTGLSLFALQWPISNALSAKPSTTWQELGVLEKIEPATPIVIDWPHSYLPAVYYSDTPSRYYFPLDWETALLPENALNATQDFQAMEALKRQLPEQNILPTAELLALHPRFLVVSRRLWLEHRILHDPRFRATKVPGLAVYVVERLSPDVR